MQNRFSSYEDMGWVRFNVSPYLPEAYRGSDIVDWHGRIEQSLVNLLNDAEKASNTTYANRIRAFLETWRENPIDGSLNRETIVTLSAAAKQWSREDWDLQSYFLSLHTKLRQLIASEEELPRDVDTSRNDPLAGTSGGAGGSPPMSPSFGPTGGAPDDLGDLGGGGGGGGAGAGGDLGGDMMGAEGAETDPAAIGADEGTPEGGAEDANAEDENFDPKDLLAKTRNNQAPLTI